jgi:predicted transport protein
MASPDEMTANMIANLKEKTGRDLAAWLKLVAQAKLAKHGEIVKWLKDEHALTHGYANLVAHKALKSDAGSAGAETDLVAAQYAGNKAGLRAIYDALARAVAKLGADVELAPKKAYVSLRRAKQFGLIQPSTATRVDVGLNLKGEPPTSRLEASGSFNAMVTHRVRVESVAEVDKQLVGWLRQAYDRA